MSELKIGDVVIATKKSLMQDWWEDFQKESGYLQAGKITHIQTNISPYENSAIVETFNKHSYHFLEGDLTKVE